MKRNLRLFITVFIFCFCYFGQSGFAQTITTVAGSGSSSFSGDGGAAVSAALQVPLGVATDTLGNFYFADTYNNKIRKVNPSGIISTIAGSLVAAFGGDGGPATAAHLNHPVGIAVDASLNIYIADEYNFRIRKISPDGIISTIAGSSTSSFSGDGGPATAANFNSPVGVAVDNIGNIYIADNSTHTIRVINSSGIIHTIAGTGTSGYSGDGGAASAATLNEPYGVAVDTSGNIYVADQGNQRIRKVNTSGIISTVAGTGTYGFTGDGGPATAAEVASPWSVAVDRPGNVYIVTGNHVREVTTSGIISTFAGLGPSGFSGDGGDATAAELYFPNGAATDAAGNLYIADAYNNRVRRVNICPFPSVSRLSGTDTFCAGTSTTMTDTTTGGIWSSSFPSVASISTSGVLTGLTSGFTLISYTKTSSCGTSLLSHPVFVRPAALPGTISGASTICPGSSSSVTSTGGIGGGTWHSDASGIASVNASGGLFGISAGTATISYSVSNSCGTGVATFPVTVSPSPFSGVISGSSTICTGTSTVLEDTTTGGVWRSLNTSVATIASVAGITVGEAAGVDTVEYSVTNFCGTARTIRIMTIVAPPGVPDSIAGPSRLCIGATSVFSDTVTGGEWASDASGVASVSATSGEVSGLSPGTSIITYTVTNSCGSASVTHSLTVLPHPSAGTISGPAYLCAGTTATLSDTVAGGWWHSDSSFVSFPDSMSGHFAGAASGTAVVTYYVSGACGIGTTTYTVEVDPLPVAGIISGPDTVCQGATITLLSTVSGTYWLTSDAALATVSRTTGAVTGVAGGIVTIRNVFFNVCGADTSRFSMFVNPLIPDPGAIAGQHSICAGDTVTLSDYAYPASGFWSSSDRSVCTITGGGFVTAIAEGLSTISYTVRNSCGGIASATQLFTVFSQLACETGIVATNTPKTPISVYPNPSDGNFSVKGTLPQEFSGPAFTSTIFDINGKIIDQQLITDNQGLIDYQMHMGNTWSNGIYLLKLSSGQSTKLFTVVISK